jgi:hypothetical protein
MKAIALIIALLIVSLGLTGVFWPEGLMQLAVYSFTATGMYVVAAIRLALGVLLMVTASATRTPKTVRVIGFLILLAGIGALFIPASTAQSLLARGPGTLRIAACFPLVAGTFIAWTTVSRRS